MRRSVLVATVAAGLVIPCNSTAQVTRAGAVEQTFALTTSAAATYNTASGAMQPMPGTSLNFTLKNSSMLIVTFSARGTVAPPTSGSMVPIVFIGCDIDGTPCQPNTNTVEFLYPQYCCDSRSFTWIVHAATAGPHAVHINWGMGNPTSAHLSNRTLAIEAARQERRGGGVARD
jgi:hypothetical protein